MTKFYINPSVGFRIHSSVYDNFFSMIERWRKILDGGGFRRALLTYFSRAPSCLPFESLITRLNECGLDFPSTKLNNTKQKTKIKNQHQLYLWHRGVVVITTAQHHATKPELRLHRLKSYSRRVGDSRWWRSLTIVPAGNKTKRFSLVSHTTKIIRHHTSCSYIFFGAPQGSVIGLLLFYIFFCDLFCYWNILIKT